MLMAAFHSSLERASPSSSSASELLGLTVLFTTPLDSSLETLVDAEVPVAVGLDVAASSSASSSSEKTLMNFYSEIIATSFAGPNVLFDEFSIFNISK